MRSHTAPVLSVENPGRRAESPFASGVRESVHGCICNSGYKLCIKKNPVKGGRLPVQKVNFTLVGRSFAGRTISAVFGRI